MPSNNVTRMLQSKRIPFQVFELSTEKHSALETAAMLGMPPEWVYKTIVVTRPAKDKPILAVIPAAATVDLKRLAKALGEKKLSLPAEKEAETITGLQAGGISPLALLNKGFQVLVDVSMQEQLEVHISGGQRGVNIRLASKDLIQLTGAKIASICNEIA